MGEHANEDVTGARLVSVGTFPSPEHAHLARNLLEANGIECFLVDEQVGWQTHIAGHTGGVQLWAKDSDAERAMQYLGAFHPPSETATAVDTDVRNRLLRVIAIGCVAGVLGGLLAEDWERGIITALMVMMCQVLLFPSIGIIWRAVRVRTNSRSRE